ncbi:DUF1772 domain-containing protein (plasmid) [Streptomyces sp. NBC_01590]
MPGLAKSSDHTFIEAMRSINKVILNPVFMLPFMGAIPLLGLAVVLAWRGHGRPALPWLIAALVLYLVAFMVTSGVNVPLNGQLARAGAPGDVAQLAVIRADFENKWVLWNIVRALLHTAAFACLAWRCSCTARISCTRTDTPTRPGALSLRRSAPGTRRSRNTHRTAGPTTRRKLPPHSVPTPGARPSKHRRRQKAGHDTGGRLAQCVPDER